LGLDVQRPQLIIHIRLPVPKDEQDLGSMLWLVKFVNFIAKNWRLFHKPYVCDQLR
jgi:hypothetical protein